MYVVLSRLCSHIMCNFTSLLRQLSCSCSLQILLGQFTLVFVDAQKAGPDLNFRTVKSLLQYSAMLCNFDSTSRTANAILPT